MSASPLQCQPGMIASQPALTVAKCRPGVLALHISLALTSGGAHALVMCVCLSISHLSILAPSASQIACACARQVWKSALEAGLSGSQQPGGCPCPSQTGP